MARVVGSINVHVAGRGTWPDEALEDLRAILTRHQGEDTAGELAAGLRYFEGRTEADSSVEVVSNTTDPMHRFWLRLIAQQHPLSASPGIDFGGRAFPERLYSDLADWLSAQGTRLFLGGDASVDGYPGHYRFSGVLTPQGMRFDDLEEDEEDDNDYEDHEGDLDLSHLESASGVSFGEEVWGELDLSGLETADGLTLPSEQVVYGLRLGSLTRAPRLVIPYVGMDLDLSGLEDAHGMVFPDRIGGDLYLGSLTAGVGVTLPREIGGDLWLESLRSAEGLGLPQRVDGSLRLDALESAEGLELPEHVGEEVRLPASLEGEVEVPDGISVAWV